MRNITVSGKKNRYDVATSNTGNFNEYLRNFAKSFDWTTRCLCELDENTGGPYLTMVSQPIRWALGPRVGMVGVL